MHQRRTSRLTKDGQSFSSIGSTLIWWLISYGARTRASLKTLRLPLLFSRHLSPTAPTAVTGLLASDRRLPDGSAAPSPPMPSQCPECCGNPRRLCRGTRSSNPFPSSKESPANLSLGERSQESPDQRRQGQIGSCGPSTGRSEPTSSTGARVSGPRRPILGPLLDAEFTGYASRSPAAHTGV
jgi:hypothetical protein